MSIVEDLKEHPTTGDKEVFVRHGSFSYLVKNVAGRKCPTADSAVEREWSVAVFPDGYQPKLPEEGCRKMKVNTDDDSVFHLQLKGENNAEIVSVQSVDSKDEPYIEIGMSQSVGASKGEPINILSRVLRDSDDLKSGKSSPRNDAPVPSKTIWDFFKDDGDKRMSAMNVVLMVSALTMLTFTFTNPHDSNKLKLVLDIKNSPKPNVDKMFMESILHLYKVATYHNIPEIQDRCVEFLKEFTEPDNLMDIIMAAHSLGGVEIKELAIKLLPVDKAILQEHSKWATMSEKFPELANEIETEMNRAVENQPK